MKLFWQFWLLLFYLCQSAASIEWDRDDNTVKLANIVARHIFSQDMDFLTKVVFDKEKPSILQINDPGVEGVYFNYSAMLRVLRQMDSQGKKFVLLFLELKNKFKMDGFFATSKTLEEKLFNTMKEKEKKELLITDGDVIKMLIKMSENKVIRSVLIQQGYSNPVFPNLPERSESEIPTKKAQASASPPQKDLSRGEAKAEGANVQKAAFEQLPSAAAGAAIDVGGQQKQRQTVPDKMPFQMKGTAANGIVGEEKPSKVQTNDKPKAVEAAQQSSKTVEQPPPTLIQKPVTRHEQRPNNQPQPGIKKLSESEMTLNATNKDCQNCILSEKRQKKLEEEFEAVQMKLEKLKMENEKMALEMAKSRTERNGQKIDSKNRNILEEIADLRKENSALQTELDGQKAKSEQLNSQNRRLIVDMDALNGEMATLKKGVKLGKGQENVIKELGNELAEAKMEADRKMERMEMELAEKNRKIANLEDKLESKPLKNESKVDEQRWQKEVETLKKVVEEKDEQKGELGRELAKFRVHFEEVDAKKRHFEREMARGQDEVARLARLAAAREEELTRNKEDCAVKLADQENEVIKMMGQELNVKDMELSEMRKLLEEKAKYNSNKDFSRAKTSLVEAARQRETQMELDSARDEFVKKMAGKDKELAEIRAKLTKMGEEMEKLNELNKKSVEDSLKEFEKVERDLKQKLHKKEEELGEMKTKMEEVIGQMKMAIAKNGENEDCAKELAETKKTLAESKEKGQKSISDLNEAEKRIAHLNSDIAAERAKSERQAKLLARARNELVELLKSNSSNSNNVNSENKLQELAKHNELKKVLEEQYREIRELQNNIVIKEKEIERLKQLLAEKENKIEGECERRLVMAKTDLLEMEAERKKVKLELAQMKEREAECRDNLGKQLANANKMKELLATKKEELEKMAEELGGMKELIAEKDGQLNGHENSMNEWANCKTDFAAKLDAREKELAASESKKKELQEKVDRIEREMANRNGQSGQTPNEELAKAVADLAKIKAEKEEIERALAKDNMELVKLKEIIEKKEKSLQICDEEKVKLSEHLAMAKKIMEECEKGFSTQLKSSNEKLAEMQQELDSTEAEKLRKMEEIRRMMAMKNNGRDPSIIEKKRKELENLEADIVQSRKEVEEMQEKVQRLKRMMIKLNQVTVDAAAKEKLKNGLKDDIDVLKSELGSTLQAKQALEGEVEERKAKLAELAKEIEEKQKVRKNLKNGLDEARKELEIVGKERQKLADAMELAKRELDEKQLILQKLNEKLGQKGKLTNGLEANLNANKELEAKAEELGKKLARLEQEIEGKEKEKEELEKLRHNLESAQNELLMRETEKRKFMKLLVELNAELEGKKQEKLELDRKLAEEEKKLEEARQKNGKAAKEKEEKKKPDEVEYPMLANSIRFGQELRQMKPCDDFYKFVCSGQDRVFKEREILTGGIGTDVARKYTVKVMEILFNEVLREKYAKKHHFMAQGFIFYKKCLNKRWKSRQAAMKGGKKAETNRNILDRIVTNIGNEFNLHRNISWKKDWLDEAVQFLPYLSIGEATRLINTSGNGNSEANKRNSGSPLIRVHQSGIDFYKKIDTKLAEKIGNQSPSWLFYKDQKGHSNLYLRLSEDGASWLASARMDMSVICYQFPNWPENQFTVPIKNEKSKIIIGMKLTGEMEQKFPEGSELEKLSKKQAKQQFYMQLLPNGKKWIASENADMSDPFDALPAKDGNLAEMEQKLPEKLKGKNGKKGRSAGKRVRRSASSNGTSTSASGNAAIKLDKFIAITFGPRLFLGEEERRMEMAQNVRSNRLIRKGEAEENVEQRRQKVWTMMGHFYKSGVFGTLTRGDDEAIKKRIEALARMEGEVKMAVGNTEEGFTTLKISELQVKAGNAIDWLKVLKGQFPERQIGSETDVAVSLKALNAWINQLASLATEKEVFSDYLLWHYLLGKMGPFANVDELYAKWYKSLEEEADLLDGLWGKKGKQVDLEGEDKQNCLKENLFVYFPHVVDRLVHELMDKDGQMEAYLEQNKQILEYVRQGFEQMLLENDWMDEATRVNALEKLRQMKEHVGFLPYTLDEPKLQQIYRPVNLDGQMDWLTMMDRMLRHLQWRMATDTQIAVMDSGHDPLQQNGAYLSSNRLIINALKFLDPSFNNSLPHAYNFAAIGRTMGHEMTHGFDTTGRQFYLEGLGMAEPGWWTEKSLEQFNGRKECLKRQYTDYGIPKYRKKAENGQTDSGILANHEGTIGEDIADNGGLRAAYKGWELFRQKNQKEWKNAAKSIKNILVPVGNKLQLQPATEEQLFFIAFAFAQCNVVSCEQKAGEQPSECNADDEHSIYRLRVNVPLRMFSEFHKAFGCQENEPMFPADQCRVW